MHHFKLILPGVCSAAMLGEATTESLPLWKTLDSCYHRWIACFAQNQVRTRVSFS